MVRRGTVAVGLYLLASTAALLLYGSSQVGVLILRPNLTPTAPPLQPPPPAGGNRTNGRQYKTMDLRDEIPIGIRSFHPDSYFRKLQQAVDQDDDKTRCRRYDFVYHQPDNSNNYPKNNKRRRRIFYGALIADEPWELFEIMAAETHGVFEAMVFVEGNRTQNYSERKFKRLEHADTLQGLFGVEQVQVRAFVNENPRLTGLAREHEQRSEIIKGWKELGMQPDDVGLLVDVDEMFTRDFLRAVQVCGAIDHLDYHSHHCEHSRVKLIGNTRVFHGSPDCISDGQTWFHPDMIVGACIEGIGDEAAHPKAPRKYKSFLREEGFGSDCTDWEKEGAITDNRYPLWDASDFRRTCGGSMSGLNTTEFPGLSPYTGFHLHNFFADTKSLRFKYRSYGHADKMAFRKPLAEMNNAVSMMYRCFMNMTDAPSQKRKRVKGGFDTVLPILPIYFQDVDYRRRRQAFMRKIFIADDTAFAERNEKG